MDTTPKRKVGRPRINPIRPPKKTAKLATAIGRSERFTFSISTSLKSKLTRLAAHNQITDGEQLRRLIDQAEEIVVETVADSGAGEGS